MQIQSPNCQTARLSCLPPFGLARRSPSLIAALGLPVMLPFVFSKQKKCCSTNAPPFLCRESLCAAVSLAGVFVAQRPAAAAEAVARGHVICAAASMLQALWVRET